MIADPTRSGKTSIILKILNSIAGQGSAVIRPGPDCIFYCYSTWQPLYEDIRTNWARPVGYNSSSHSIPLFFNEGLPSFDSFDSSQNILIVLDDLMNDCCKDKGILDIYTTNSHHKNVSVIYVAQNIFSNGKNSRKISLNCQYMISRDSTNHKN